MQQLWVFLHIAFMFASVALSVGGGWFALSAAWRRDVPALRRSLPTIGMAGLRWGVSGASKAPTASFTVLCRPGREGPANPEG